MKSPWKFLAQLIPQRRAAETGENLPNDDADRQEGEAQRVLGLPDDRNVVTGRADLVGSPPTEPDAIHASDSLETKVGVAPLIPESAESRGGLDTVLRSGADGYGSQKGSGKRKATSRTQRPIKPGPQKGARAEKVLQRTVAETTSHLAQSRPAPNAFLDEAASLDEEIRLLKIQLAQRLRLQNLQLKKMLNRFDIS